MTCLNCQRQPEYVEALESAKEVERLAFEAQEPRQVKEPWRCGMIVCVCGSDLFRDAGRTCYGHYDNYVCAECGSTESRLTETGRCF